MTIIFSLQCFCIGIDYSSSFISVWPYLKNMIKPESPKYFYLAICSSYHISAIVMSIILGKYIDQRGSVRKTFICVNMLMVIGSIVYVMPFSPWLPVLGRFIAGVGGALIPITAGETAKCYPSSVMKRKFSLFYSLYNAGFIIGPGVMLTFKSVNICLSVLNIRYENFCGLLTVVLMSSLAVISYIALDDVSNIYHINKTMVDQETKRDVSWCSLCSHVDVGFILILSFFGKYFYCAVEMWLPLLIMEVRRESITEMNMMMMTSGLISVIVLVIFSIIRISNSQIFYFSVLGNLSFCGVLGVYLLYYFFPLNAYVKMTGTLVYGVSLAGLGVSDGIFVINTLAIMSPPSKQALAESTRVSFGRAGFLCALILSPWLFDWMPFVTLVYICIVLCQAIFMLVRIKTLICPKQLTNNSFK